MMNGTKTYIYGIFEDNKPIYVGKSVQPKYRYSIHCRNGMGGDYCKILDMYYDLENAWILHFWNEGHKLKNKVTHTPVENWNVGDIITLNNI